jgi:hypothetical protein
MPDKILPSVDYIRQCVREENGYVFWLKRPQDHFKDERSWKLWNTRYSGTEAGCVRIGYHFITINNLKFKRSTIVWAVRHGELKIGLDHKNRDQLDDRIENLRVASKSQNAANCRIPSDNTSGHKGVSWCKQTGMWQVGLQCRKKRIWLGRFNNLADAALAYERGAREHFGEFASDGSKRQIDEAKTDGSNPDA